MAVKWPGTLKPTSENLERILTELERPAEASKIIIIIIIIIIIKSKEEDSVQNRNGEKREPVFCKKWGCGYFYTAGHLIRRKDRVGRSSDRWGWSYSADGTRGSIGADPGLLRRKSPLPGWAVRKYPIDRWRRTETRTPRPSWWAVSSARTKSAAGSTGRTILQRGPFPSRSIWAGDLGHRSKSAGAILRSVPSPWRSLQIQKTQRPIRILVSILHDRRIAFRNSTTIAADAWKDRLKGSPENLWTITGKGSLDKSAGRSLPSMAKGSQGIPAPSTMDSEKRLRPQRSWKASRDNLGASQRILEAI